MSGDFATRVVQWQKRHGRHDLPWQGTRDPYRIWLSEIMLQQTQVGTVIPYYRRFIARFPDVASLAGATEDEVLAHWSGLGYYSRARNLHRTARLIMERHRGRFPDTPAALAALPGVGRSTAAAIAVFAFGARAAILDGNVKRVLARHGAVEGWPGAKAVQDQLWRLAEARLPEGEIEAYTQGLMDLGAAVCTRRAPRCDGCPVAQDCLARIQNRVDELPAPRPRKALPERAIAVLVLLCGGEVLLEKRPPSGVWGGLWSLPEIPVDADPIAAARDRYGVHAARPQALPPLAHGFTHFRLRIQPWLLQGRCGRGHVGEAGALWLPLAEVTGAALPAPLKKLLARLPGG